MIAAILVSPEFLYRTLPTPKAAGDRAAFLLTDLELASRLSFFLWSQGPDEALLNIAFQDSPGFWLLCPYDTEAMQRLVEIAPRCRRCSCGRLSEEYSL